MGTVTQTIYEALRRKGPSTPDELGMSSISIETRQAHADLMRLQVRGGKNSPVLYCEGIHDERDVVRRYIEVNPHVVDKPFHAVTMAFGDYSDDMRDAWREIGDEYVDRRSNNGGADGGRGGTCPLCEEDYDDTLPAHLGDNCDA